MSLYCFESTLYSVSERSPDTLTRPWGRHRVANLLFLAFDFDMRRDAYPVVIIQFPLCGRRYLFTFRFFDFITAACDSDDALNRARLRPWGGAQIESAGYSSSSRYHRDVTLTERGRAVTGCGRGCCLLAQATLHQHLCSCLPFSRCSGVSEKNR